MQQLQLFKLSSAPHSPLPDTPWEDCGYLKVPQALALFTKQCVAAT